jgi:hypothetical protein
MNRSLAFIVALLALTATAAGQDIREQGCIVAGVEAQCLILKTATATYDVTAAEPTPKVGEFGTVTGTPFEGVTICQQAKALKPSTWEPVAGKACPAN